MRNDCNIRITNVLPSVDAHPGVAFPISFRKAITKIKAIAKADITIENIRIRTAVVSIITDMALNP